MPSGPRRPVHRNGYIAALVKRPIADRDIRITDRYVNRRESVKGVTGSGSVDTVTYKVECRSI